MSLGAPDLRALLATTDRLAADPPPDFTTVCALLGEVIPSRSVSFNDMALDSGDFRYVIAPPQDEALAARLKPAYDRHVHQHPLVARGRAHPVNGALRFCDVEGGNGFEETELYKEFYEPFGLRYQLVIQLPAPPSVIVGYALNRGREGGEFSDRDVAVLDALAGHLAMHHRILNDRERSRAVTTEAGRAGWTVLTVRSDGVIDQTSWPAGPSSLRRGETIPESIASLLPSHGNLRGSAESHDVVIDAERWRCVVHPVRVGPTVLLLRSLGTESAELTPLIDAGLTHRQAEIARELARTGAANTHLARALGISEGTVKKHLEAVFRVLGVDSRTAAAVAVSELVAGRSRRSLDQPPDDR